MDYASHLQELHGLPAFDFPPPGADGELPEPDTVAWRLVLHWWDDSTDESYEEMWDRFLRTVDPGRVRALIIGQWGDCFEEDSGVVVEQLVAARDRLTALEAVFIADLEGEECEISWIKQCDVTPVLDAYPALRMFGVRGGTELRFPTVKHEHLRTLRFEAGGLPGEVVRGVAASELPALEHLELWLGVEYYSGDATVADLAPILSGGRFPALRHLGLQDSELQDEIAAAVASAPVVAQLDSLSLSMGVLTDAGAEALLNGQPLTHLRRLDLSHHFLSDAIADRLGAALASAGTEVDLSDQQTPDPSDDEGRYVAVAE